MNKKKVFILFGVLLGLFWAVGVAQASPDSLAVNAAWNDSLADGDLTYKISGGDETARGIVRTAVEEWGLAVEGLTLTEITDRTKPNVDIKFKRGGGQVQGQALYSFDEQGFIKSVKINISGKAFGEPNNADIVAQIGKHEFAHALGVGHTNFAGDLMSTTVTAGTGVISACDIAGVIAANHWALDPADAPIGSPHSPHVGSVPYGGPVTPLAHDVAVTGVTPASTIVLVGNSVNVDVDVANEGSNTETFDVTLTDTTAGVPIGTTTVVALGSGASTNVGFVWVTTGASTGGHVLEAEAVLATDEDTTDNTDSTTVIITDGTTAVYHSASITPSVVNQGGPWYRLTATIEIHDAGGPVGEGLTVRGTISRDGRAPFDFIKITDGSGQVRFGLRTRLTETLYTIEVTDVDDGAGGTFDSTIGESSDTICIHNDGTFGPTCS